VEQQPLSAIFIASILGYVLARSTSITRPTCPALRREVGSAAADEPGFVPEFTHAGAQHRVFLMWRKAEGQLQPGSPGTPEAGMRMFA
jgi:hypothetical protein